MEAVGGTKTPEIPTKVGATPRVEKEAGEKRVGCGCSHPLFTATGNAGRRRTFGVFRSHILGWVAIEASTYKGWLQCEKTA